MRRGALALATALFLLQVGPARGAIPADAGIELGGVFGRARAEATSLTSEAMRLDLEVEADDDAAVVAHLIDPGGSQETLPMAPRGEGLFGIRTEIRKVDYVVVFEAVQASLAAESQPLRLTELGADPAVLGVSSDPAVEAEEISESTRQWGWAGLGLAAAALTLLAFWALPDRRRRARAAAAFEAGARPPDQVKGDPPAEMRDGLSEETDDRVP